MIDKRQEQLLEYISVKVSQGLTVLDATLEYCEEFGVEVEVLGNYIRKDLALYQRIEAEALKHNMLDKNHYKIDSIDDLFE